MSIIAAHGISAHTVQVVAEVIIAALLSAFGIGKGAAVIRRKAADSSGALRRDGAVLESRIDTLSQRMEETRVESKTDHAAVRADIVSLREQVRKDLGTLFEEFGRMREALARLEERGKRRDEHRSESV